MPKQKVILFIFILKQMSFISKWLFFLGLFTSGFFFSFSQTLDDANKTKLQRPKLVVGLVVDQMRWDFLYRYYDRYAENGGFKRLLNQGFRCENTFIDYLPSATAVGHTTIYTGSVPAIHGITGNSFIDRSSGKTMYCVGDSTVSTVGAKGSAGKMSPRNLLATTITDELRIATNFQSRVIGVGLKDRGAIIPAGHNPTGAYWLDDESGNFITSSYYQDKLPQWVNKFNEERNIRKLIANGWNTLYPINSYKQSTEDNVPWEGTFPGEDKSVFPHDIAGIYKKSPVALRQSPFGNTLLTMFAKAAIESNNLGRESTTDFLAVSFSTPDYIGHMFGPNSIEIEDIYLRLDQDLGSFFSYLDQKVGKDNYVVFLTADHGASNSIQYNVRNKIPADALNARELLKSLNQSLQKKFKIPDLARTITSYQVFFNYKTIETNQLDFSKVKAEAINFLRTQPGVSFAVDLDNVADATLPERLKQLVINGYNFKRSGDVQIINEPGWYFGGLKGTSHGSYSPYDTHIPLIFMGGGIKPGSTDRPVHMSDIAPTLSSLLKIQMSNGSVGRPVTEARKGDK